MVVGGGARSSSTRRLGDGSCGLGASCVEHRRPGARRPCAGRPSPGLGLLPPVGQRPLGVAVGLLPPGEHQLQRRLERRAVLEVLAHRLVAGFAGVLLVHEHGHPGEGLAHLGLVHETVVQPVRDLLAGDAQRRPVFHQADALQVRHRRAADAQPDPAHDVAEDRLRVRLQLVALLLVGEPGAAVGQHRHDQQLAPVRQGARRQLRPAPPSRPSPGSAARAGWPPSGEGTQAVFAPAFGWAPLVSSIARMPAGWAHMPLPIWACPANPARSATSTLRSSYALQPDGGLLVVLADDRAGLEVRVDLVAGAVQEARC